MTQKDIRIGIVGANSTASWAKVSHIPAIQSLRGVKLAAVATRNEQSAREAADAFGAEHWFSDPFAMIRDDSRVGECRGLRQPERHQLGWHAATIDDLVALDG